MRRIFLRITKKNSLRTSPERGIGRPSVVQPAGARYERGASGGHGQKLHALAAGEDRVDAYLSPEHWAALHRISAERGMALCLLAYRGDRGADRASFAGAEVQPQEARAP